jgi:hypothetical protein
MPFDSAVNTIFSDRKSNASGSEVPAAILVDLKVPKDELGAIDVDLKGRLSFQVVQPRAVVKMPELPRFVAVQEWEGFVVDISHETAEFTARLANLTDDSDYLEEEVTLALDEIDEDDRELVKVGAVFRWIVGYQQAKFARRESVSSIVFRRLPAWTAEDISRARARGEALANAFQWE